MYNTSMKNTSIIIGVLITVLLLLFVWPFMGSTQSKSGRNSSQNITKKINIVVSNFALYDIATHLLPDERVDNILPFGSDIHTFEPTPKDIVKIQNADLFFYSGDALEPWVAKFHFQKHAIAMQKYVSLLRHKHHTDDEDHEEEHHHHLQYDPHYWLDIDNMITMTKIVADALIKRLPSKSASIVENSENYIEALQEADTFFRMNMQNCALDTIVTNHDAFEYLAKRYGFKVAAISGLSPDAQASAHVMSELVHLVEQKKIKTLFFESFVSDKLINTIAKESGVKDVEVLFPLANVTHSQAKEGFITLFKEDAQKISHALECSQGSK